MRASLLVFLAALLTGPSWGMGASNLGSFRAFRKDRRRSLVLDRAQKAALCSKGGPEEIHRARELWEAARRNWVASEKVVEEGRKELEQTRNEAKDQEKSVRDARRTLDKVRAKVQEMLSHEGDFKKRLGKDEAKISKMREELESRRAELDRQEAALKKEQEALEAKEQDLVDRQSTIHGLDVWSIQDEQEQLEIDKRSLSVKKHQHKAQVKKLEEKKAEISKHEAKLDKNGEVHDLVTKHRSEEDEKVEEKRNALRVEEGRLAQLEHRITELAEQNSKAQARVDASRKALNDAMTRLVGKHDQLFSGLRGMQDALGLRHEQVFGSYEEALGATEKAMQDYCDHSHAENTKNALENLRDHLAV